MSPIQLNSTRIQRFTISIRPVRLRVIIEKKHSVTVLTIVIPAYNEESNISGTMQALRESISIANVVYPIEVIIVNDCSTDRTAEYALDCVSNAVHQMQNLSARLINLSLNMGLVRACMIGAANGSYRFLKILCGDNSEPANALAEQLIHVGRVNVIIPIHRSVINKSRRRLWLSNVYTKIFNLVSGLDAEYVNGCGIYPREQFLRHVNPSHKFGFQAYVYYAIARNTPSMLSVYIDDLTHDDSNQNALTHLNLIGVMHAHVSIALRRINRIFF